MGKLNVLGVMAGNGVCLYPFRKRFNIIGNWELRPVFYDKKDMQFNLNFPNVQQYRELKVYKRKVDVIIGHPDCGDSSVLRLSRAKKAGDAKENHSIAAFLTGIMQHQPDYWLMENLPGLLKSFPQEYWMTAFPEYRILIHEASVSAWGNSQVSRKRLVIIGVHRRKPESFLKYFKLPICNAEDLKTSEYFELGKAQDVNKCHVRESPIKTCNLYYKDLRQITYSFAEDLWNGEFKGKGRWPVGGKMNNQPGVSRNLVGNYPLTVRKQNRQFGTQGLVLSPREMSNIQGIPVSFDLHFEEKDRIYWINKARLTVTKTMPYDIAKWFANQVFKASKRDYKHSI